MIIDERIKVVLMLDGQYIQKTKAGSTFKLSDELNEHCTFENEYDADWWMRHQRNYRTATGGLLFQKRKPEFKYVRFVTTIEMIDKKDHPKLLKKYDDLNLKKV